MQGPTVTRERPDVAAKLQPTAVQPLRLDASQIEPIHQEILAVDLSTVVRVALADSLDIRRARQQVEASQGALESSVGAAFPALVPSALFDRVEGSVRATEGRIVGVGFNTFQPSIAVQWVLNPGKVIYQIIAAKKRLSASEQNEQAVLLETVRQAAVQYYELVLAQATVSASHQSVAEAEELLRIAKLRAQTGTGVLADELRAESLLAARGQDLLVAINGFYNASVELAVTLHLKDATVTLVPALDELPANRLVRDDLDLEELLAIAVAYRPDLESVRTLAAATTDDKGATWWGAFGPGFQVAYQYGGITGNADNTNIGEGIPPPLILNPRSADGSFTPNPLANGFIRESIRRGSRRAHHDRNETFSFSDQQRASASVGAKWSLSAIGDLKTAAARSRQAYIDAERQLDQVRAQVVRADLAAKTHEKLIGLADQQVKSAREALRLTQANLEAGVMTTLDVLQAQEAVAQARLRYAEAVVRYNQAEVNLLAAIGLLNGETLRVSNSDPTSEAQQQVTVNQVDPVKSADSPESL
ncbi:MAG: TolC family protein [Phycisphaerae bacterium]